MAAGSILGVLVLETLPEHTDQNPDHRLAQQEIRTPLWRQYGCIPLTSGILEIMDTPSNVFSTSKAYMEILFIGIPLLAVFNTYSAVLRGLGDSRTPFLPYSFVLSATLCSI